jgi:hypothetical protein
MPFIIPAKILMKVLVETVSAIAESSGVSLFKKVTGAAPKTSLLAAMGDQLDSKLGTAYSKNHSNQPEGMRFKSPGDSSPDGNQPPSPRLK